MERVLVIPLAVLHKLKLLLHGLPVLLGRIIASLTLAAGEGDYLDNLLLAGHGVFLDKRLTKPVNRYRPASGPYAEVHALSMPRAPERNRTVDLILTMDVLCQLSYRGWQIDGTIATDPVFVNSCGLVCLFGTIFASPPEGAKEEGRNPVPGKQKQKNADKAKY